MNEKLVTITVTEEDAGRIYRACMARSYEFAQKHADDLEGFKMNKRIRERFKNIANEVLKQTGIKI